MAFNKSLDSLKKKMGMKVVTESKLMPIVLPVDIYKASLGVDPKKWMKWINDNGFSIDKKSNHLFKDGVLWKIDSESKSLVPQKQISESEMLERSSFARLENLLNQKFKKTTKLNSEYFEILYHTNDNSLEVKHWFSKFIIRLNGDKFDLIYKNQKILNAANENDIVQLCIDIMVDDEEKRLAAVKSRPKYSNRRL